MRHRIGLAVILVLAAAGGWGGDEAAGAKLALKTERVIIFKDGFGLFVKAATGTADKDGRVWTDVVPDGAVLGTFWAASADNRGIGMRAEWVDDKKERATETACISILELLRANKGKKVTLSRSMDKQHDLNGTIVELLDLPPETPRPVPAGVAAAEHALHLSALRPATAEHAAALEVVREIAPRGGQYVVLDTDAGRQVIAVGDVKALVGPELVTKMERREEVTTRTKRLTFELGKEAAGQKAVLRILYFSEGVRWIPTYRIFGDLKDFADIALQGEILNEAEDFENAAIDLVVGVPNFRFKTTISPLSLEGTLRQALVTAAPGLMGNQYSNATFSQRAGEWTGRARAGANGGENALNLAPELAAAGTQDLFVYSAKSLSLKNGARATLPLWQSAAPLRHLYTMDVKMYRHPQTGSYSSVRGRDQMPAESPLKLAENKVWHQLELSNTSKMPWTTGAALTMRDLLPLGQDLLTYTPAGGASLLPLTVAVDMCGSYSEEEIGRQANAMHWDTTAYAMIRKKGTIVIDNLRKEKSQTRVTVSLGGKAEKASDGGKVRLDDYNAEDWQQYGNSGHVNNHSDVTWELSLEPGEKKTLTFELVIYVR